MFKGLQTFYKKYIKNNKSYKIEKLQQEIDLINYKFNKKINQLNERIDWLESDTDARLDEKMNR